VKGCYYLSPLWASNARPVFDDHLVSVDPTLKITLYRGGFVTASLVKREFWTDSGWAF